MEGQIEELTSMNDHLLQFTLHGGFFHNFLVNGVGCDQPENQHRLGLADSVTSILGLQITLRILSNKRDEISNYETKNYDALALCTSINLEFYSKINRPTYTTDNSARHLMIHLKN